MLRMFNGHRSCDLLMLTFIWYLDYSCGRLVLVRPEELF